MSNTWAFLLSNLFFTVLHTAATGYVVLTSTILAQWCKESTNFVNSALYRYLAGGVETGFKKVEKDKYEPRLLHVKGRRNIRVWQVPK